MVDKRTKLVFIFILLIGWNILRDQKRRRIAPDNIAIGKIVFRLESDRLDLLLALRRLDVVVVDE